MSQATCSGPECARPARTRGYCAGHHAQVLQGRPLARLRVDKRTAGIPTPICTFPDCERPAFANRLCNAHGLQQRAGRELTAIAPRHSALIRDEHGRKRCYSCKEWQEEHEFYLSRRERDGLTGQCKSCQSADSRRGTLLKYGLNEDQYAALLDAQGGVCAVCRQVCARGTELSVDHDHTCCPGTRSCGKCVRGLLCRACNAGIGLLRDDPALVQSAATYLARGVTLAIP